MKKYIKSSYLLAVITAFISLSTVAQFKSDVAIDDDLNELINQTDQIKTSDSAQFKQNLNKLQNRFDSASIQQQEFISYLQSYENVLDGDFDNAQQGLQKLFLEATSLNIKIRIKATLANIQAISREYGKSLVNLDYVIDNVEATGDDSLTNKINLVSSIVYFLLEIYDMSLKYSELVVDKKPDAVMLCKSLVYNKLSRIKLKIDLDEKRIHETIDLCKKNNQIIYASLLELEWIHKELEAAFLEKDTKLISTLLNRVKMTESEVDKFGYNNLIGFKDMILAKAYYYNGQVDLAFESANKSIEGSTRSGNTSQVVDALKILQQVAVNQKEYLRAYQLGNRINQVENEIYSEAKSKQMAYMSVKHNNLAQEMKIEQLNQNNQVLELKNELARETSQKQQLMMLLVLTGLVMLGFWTYKIKRRHDYFKDVSEVDHLTQVFTRKAFDERLEQIIETSQAKSEPVNIAILDLDHFKVVNDKYGHMVGDWVLQNIIIACENVTDQDAMIARLGGEEFAIVTPAISLQKTLVLLEKMRSAIENLDCSPTGHQFNVTASFGVTSSLISGLNKAMLLSHADVALFQAKNNGRNKVVVFDA